jgi:serine O-acetyltransferase
MEGVGRLRLSLPKEQLRAYVDHLVANNFPDGVRSDLDGAFETALDRLEHCFNHVALRGYRDDRGATFNYLHGDQFAAFLYFLSNSLWRAGDSATANKISLLNRMRHGIVIMPDTILPDIFCIPHTVGTVIGKGTYGDYLVVCQNVTIANDITTVLTFGKGIILFPGVFIVGAGTVGSGSIVTANSTVAYTDVPPNSMVRGMSPNLEVWPRKRDLLNRFFINTSELDLN